MLNQFPANQSGWIIHRNERRWALLFAAVVALLTTLPYLFAAGQQGEQWVFTGFVFGVEDGNTYLAKMLSGAAGDWLFRTPYTYLPQNGSLAYLPYLLIGKLAVLPLRHGQFVLLYHLFRIAGIFAYCLASYSFIGYFIEEIKLRRLGLLLAALGGGVGWLLAVFGGTQWLASLPRGAIPGLDLPLAFYSPEAFGFLMLYGLPHLAFGRAFLLWGLLAVLSGTRWPARDILPGMQGGMAAGLLLIAVGLMQPISVLVSWAVLAAFLLAVLIKLRDINALIHSIYLARAIWAVAISAPLLVYNYLVFSSDPVLNGWSVQNNIISPNPLYFLLAYLLFVPLAVIGARRLARARGLAGLLPFAWVLTFPILAYAPLAIQRRLTEGVWIAWLVLGLSAVSSFNAVRRETNRPSSNRWLYRYLFAAAALSLAPTLILLIGGIRAAAAPSEPLFRRREQVQAFESLSDLAQPGEVVLASYPTGNALPAWAPLRVVVGHGSESVRVHDLLPLVEAFFQSTTADDQRRQWLQEWRVRYIYWGTDERALGNWDPNTAPYLERVVEVGDLEIFAIR